MASTRLAAVLSAARGVSCADAPGGGAAATVLHVNRS